MTTRAHDESCEGDWGQEGQESPCRCGDRLDECQHETFSSRYIGRGVYRHGCQDCGEIKNVDSYEWSK